MKMISINKTLNAAIISTAVASVLLLESCKGDNKKVQKDENNENPKQQDRDEQEDLTFIESKVFQPKNLEWLRERAEDLYKIDEKLWATPCSCRDALFDKSGGVNVEQLKNYKGILNFANIDLEEICEEQKKWQKENWEDLSDKDYDEKEKQITKNLDTYYKSKYRDCDLSKALAELEKMEIEPGVYNIHVPYANPHAPFCIFKIEKKKKAGEFFDAVNISFLQYEYSNGSNIPNWKWHSYYPYLMVNGEYDANFPLQVDKEPAIHFLEGDLDTYKRERGLV